MVLDIENKTATTVIDALNNMRSLLGKKFGQVFKTITADNCPKFADLSTLKDETDTKMYFSHSYYLLKKVIMSIIMV